LNTGLFIAKRLFGSKKEKKFSKPVLGFNVAGIALGIAVMVLSVLIVTGFKNEITEKVIGFGSHIQITNFDSNQSYETLPIQYNPKTITSLLEISGIEAVQSFANKYGILKKGTEFHGVVLKGVGKQYDWNFYKKNLVAGQVPQYNDTATSNGILISEEVASALKLGVGDPVGAFFIQEPPRMRRFEVQGVFRTSLEEFDRTFILCDIKHVQRLNGWNENQVSGYEITTDNYKKIENYADKVFNLVGFDFLEGGSKYKITTIAQKYPFIFDWLKLQDLNVWVILLIMITVASFNIISGLLILVLDRTQMIGILKAIGGNNKTVKKVFIYQSLFISAKGMLLGNVIALTIGAIQWKFNLIKLDPTAYFLEAVPIHFNFPLLLALNVGVLFIVFLILLGPSAIISKIDPSRSIRFE